VIKLAYHHCTTKKECQNHTNIDYGIEITYQLKDNSSLLSVADLDIEEDARSA